jgi:opacity protein-like surface antigen
MNETMKSVALACGMTLAAMAPAQAQGFEGGYAGIYAGARLTALTPWMGGVQGGYNFALGSGAIAGVEGDLGVTSTGTVLGTASGRVGYAFGSDVMLYGSAGVGMTDASTTYYQFGGGGEFNVTEDVYLRAQVDRLKAFSGGAPLWLGKIGAGYRF